MAGIRESNHIPHFFDLQKCSSKEVLGLLKAQLFQICPGSTTDLNPKEVSKAGGGEIHLPCDLVE